MTTFGNQTVVFVTVAEDPSQRDEHNNPLIVRTPTPVPGCRFRPLSASEKVALGIDVAKDPWRITAPPVNAVTGAQAGGEIEYGDETYQIRGGPRTFPGVGGRPYKVTVICERREV